MAVLTTKQRLDVIQELCSLFSVTREPVTLTKIDLGAAVHLTDDWVDDNELAVNLNLPPEAQNELTVDQKRQVFLQVISKRTEVFSG